MMNRIAVNTSASVAFRLFSVVLNLVLVPVLIGAVGADGFGLILLAQALMGYLSLFNGGVPMGTVKYVAEYEARGDRGTVDKVVASSLSFSLGAGAAVALGVVLFTRLGGLGVFDLRPENVGPATSVLYIGAALALVSWPLATFGQVLEGLQRYPENKLALGVGDLVSKLSAIVGATVGLPIEGIFLLLNLGAVIAAPAQVWAVRRALVGWTLRARDFSLANVRMILSYSVWALLDQLAGKLIYQTDRIILGLYLPIEAITIYHVITTPFLAVADVAATVRSALTPAVSSAYARSGLGGLNTFVYTLSRYSNALVAVIAVAGLYVAGPFIQLWVGEGYEPYLWIAQLACASQVLIQSNSVLANVYFGSGHIKRITVVILSLAVLNVPLGVWWTQVFGVGGVIFATMFIAAVEIPLQYAFVMSQFGIEYRRYFLDSVVRAQLPAVLVGLAAVPAWGLIQDVAGWLALVATAAALVVAAAAASWALTVRDEDKVWALNKLRYRPPPLGGGPDRPPGSRLGGRE